MRRQTNETHKTIRPRNRFLQDKEILHKPQPPELLTGFPIFLTIELSVLLRLQTKRGVCQAREERSAYRDAIEATRGAAGRSGRRVLDCCEEVSGRHEANQLRQRLATGPRG